MNRITQETIESMSYVQLMAFLEEVNRPPGGKDSIRQLVQNCFIVSASEVLDVGCNTGYCAFELAHLAKCKVVGVDISQEMIEAANKIKSQDPLKELVNFKVADAMQLPFPDESFDVVMSGGSTAFIEDKQKAVEEYKRVVRPWGFVADINFFYKTDPPKEIIQKLNELMSIDIQPWDINYWLNLYDKCGLEKYFVYTSNMKEVSEQEVDSYCSLMVQQKNLTSEAEKVLKERLVDIMNLFNQNHKYLSYGVFISRKRPQKEQPSLFGA